MRKNLLRMMAALLISTAAFGSGPVGERRLEPGRGAAADLSFIYDYLAPYGNWIELAPYGCVWAPRHMGYRWRPYTEGRWLWSDAGWTWISGEVWGEIPFHYGRWGFDEGIGWFWKPDSVWAPAWVAWRSNDLYFGWAPLPPAFTVGSGADLDAWSKRASVKAWVFVEAPHFLDHGILPSVLPVERNPTIIEYTEARNTFELRGGLAVNEGMGNAEVRRIARKDVPKCTLRDMENPGSTRVAGNEVEIYRPAIAAGESGRPKELMSLEEARRKLAPAMIWEPRSQRPAGGGGEEIQKLQSKELKLLEKSQSWELAALQRSRAGDRKSARDAADKSRIDKDYETRILDLREHHALERQEMIERHKSDLRLISEMAQAGRN